MAIQDINLVKDIADIREAIAYLSEQIEEARADQDQKNQGVMATLELWNKHNLVLTETLTRQAEDSITFSQQQQRLAECLIALSQHSGRLESATTELKFSLENLSRYLNEEQSPQVVQLAENTAMLKDSSANLVQFVTGEQTQRSKKLEDGMRSLILILEQIPGIEKAKKLVPEKQAMTLSVGKKSQSFDLVDFLTNNLLTSFCTVILIIVIFYASGVGKQISRSEERSVWSIIKLDKIEQYFGID